MAEIFSIRNYTDVRHKSTDGFNNTRDFSRLTGGHQEHSSQSFQLGVAID
jgi:hypothetical protein